jgi:hypothetical protein
MTQCAAMYLEHRSEPRFDCHVHMVGATTVAFDGVVRDVSLSGVCLHTQTPLEPGRQLHLDFELSTGRIEAVGEVRRVTSSADGLSLGVRFVRISAECLEAIRLAQEVGVKPAGAGAR